MLAHKLRAAAGAVGVSYVAPTYKTQTAIATGTTAANVAAASGVVADDVIVIIARSDSSAISTPSGYTQVAATSTVSSISLRMFYKVATGADASTTVSSAGSGYTAAIKIVISGVDPADPFEGGFLGTTTTPTTTANFFAPTTTIENTFIVAATVATGSSGSTTFSSYSSFLTDQTERFDQGTNIDGFAGVTGVRDSAGSSTAITATATSTLTAQARQSAAFRGLPA